MQKSVWLLLLSFFIVGRSCAGEWSLYTGGGLSYDAFLRDKEVMTTKSKWPFQLGANILVGASYRTEIGFNVFADCNTGITRIQMPVPDVKKSNNFYEQTQVRFMIGSGPKLLVGDKGNFITPFIQLGAAYFNNFGTSGVGKDDENVSIMIKQDIDRDSWRVVFGAGLDWQFAAKNPSSINLQFAYTPLPIFLEPVDYVAATNKGVYDLKMQGKLFQTVLSYKVYFPLNRR